MDSDIKSIIPKGYQNEFSNYRTYNERILKKDTEKAGINTGPTIRHRMCLFHCEMGSHALHSLIILDELGDFVNR